MTMFTANHMPIRTHRLPRLGLGHPFTVWKQRQALRALDANALKDIGLTRVEANAEADRSFWDAPESWRN